MERASNEHAILWCGNFALTSDPNATRMTYHFADHVFSCMAMSTRFQGLHIHLTSTDRPFGDVIWPDIGGHRGRRFTKPLRWKKHYTICNIFYNTLYMYILFRYIKRFMLDEMSLVRNEKRKNYMTSYSKNMVNFEVF